MNENETEVVVDDDNYDVDLSEYENLTEDDGDGNQTDDLILPGDGYIYDSAAKAWSFYRSAQKI